MIVVRFKSLVCYSSLLTLYSLLLASCATPQLPPGGPVDAEGPVVVSAEPEPGAVGVSASQLTLRFDEYVEQRSFEQAFSITPEFSERVRFRWHARSVDILFPEPLRANTTYVVTIGTDFRDVRGQKIRQPITLAFATGPTINRGTLAGIVRDPATGQPAPDLDVFAYALTDSLPPDPQTAAPAYRTQTGANGQFTLSYLSDTPFYLLALRDRNRNRRLDPGEFFAVPPAPALTPTDSVTATPTFWLARLDTTPPQPQRVRTLSSRRVEVRFDEPVTPTSLKPEIWSVVDSLAQQPVTVWQVYQPPEQASVVVLETEAMQDRRYRLTAERSAVADTSGTLSAAFAHSFTGSVRPDTFALRFAAFLPPGSDSVRTLLPREAPGLRFSLPPDTALIRTTATLATPSGTVLPYALRPGPDGSSVFFDLPVSASEFRLTLDGIPFGRDSLLAQAYRRLTADDTGGLSGTVRPARNVFVELYAAIETNPRYIAPADATGTFIFTDIPAGHYRLRAFQDEDQNGSWSSGTAYPYRPAEPLVWAADSVRVRARFVNALPDTLRLGDVRREE